jgi:hypothetical protein
MGAVGETDRAGGGSRSSTVACQAVSYCCSRRGLRGTCTPRYLLAHSDCIASFTLEAASPLGVSVAMLCRGLAGSSI